MRKKTKFAVAGLVSICVGTFLLFFFAVAQFNIPFTFYKYNSFAGAIDFGSDFKGGSYALYDIADDEDTANLDERLENSAKRLNDILIDRGVPVAAVNKEGQKIRVYVNSSEDYQAVLQLFGNPANISFKVSGRTENLTKYIKNASLEYGRTAETQNRLGIAIELEGEGVALYKDLTKIAKDEARKITVTLDGTDITVEEIGVKDVVSNGKQFLTLSSTVTDANKAGEATLQLLAGSFDIELSFVKYDKFSPVFGQNALLILGIVAIVGFLAVIAYMVARYRAMGAMTSVSFILFVAIYLLLIYSFPYGQFTSVGLAAAVIGLAMAAAMYFIIFSRVEEEYKTGKTVHASVAAGMNKSLWSVLDGNILVTLLSICFYIVGSVTLRTMGVILIMGAVFSVLTSLFVARVLIKWLTVINENNKLYGLAREVGITEISDDEEPQNTQE